jgi:hypothetical protein
MESKRVRGECRNCGQIGDLADSARIGDQTYGLCADCTQQLPDYVRAASSKARVLGIDVDDVRHGLRD